MTTSEIFILALALSMDAFSVALATSLKGFNSWKHIFRMSSYFGFFQFLMPVLGWMLMVHFQSSVADFAKYIAFTLLCAIGAKMIYEQWQASKDVEGKEESIPTAGTALILLAVATSLDAMAVGISFASLNYDILYPSILIGIICFITTVLAMECSKLIAQRFRIIANNANCIGGTILILIGIRILFT